MIGLFGFDPKTLSDEELLDRAAELNRRIMWASKFASGEIVANLIRFKEAVEFEQRERLILPRLQARAALPPVLVETDPDLAKEHRDKIEQEAEAAKKASQVIERRKPFSITRDRIKPTSRPTSDPDGQ